MRTSLLVKAQLNWSAGFLFIAIAYGMLVPSTAWPVSGSVQAASGSATGQTSARIRLRPTRPGSTLVVCVGSGEAVTSISDNKANSYTLAGSITNSSGAGTLRVYHTAAALGGVSAITLTHAWGASDIVVAEYSGVGAADRFQAQDAGYNTGAAWSSGPAPGTRQANELLVGCAFEVYGVAVPQVTFTAGSGFTPRGRRRGLFLEDRRVSESGSYEASGARIPASNLNVVAALLTFRVGAPTGGTDNQPPSIPAGLVTTAASSTEIGLAWSAATDNVGVAGYRVMRGGVQIATVTTATVYRDKGLTPATAYTYAVAAYDAAGNVSAASAPVQATTQPVPPPPPVTQSEPAILFLDVASGPNSGGPENLGAPISIFGKGFGASQGVSTVTIGGVPVARTLLWGQRNANNPELDMIVVQPGAAVSGGPVVVTVNGHASNADHSYTVNGGAVYYIAPNGADSAPCSESAPCATIERVATQVMRAGDLVLVRGGTYAESEVWIRGEYGHSGAPGAQKAIKVFPGEEAFLVNPARPFIVDADYITLSGFHFRNGKSTGIPDTGLPGRRGNRFINNTFTGTIAWGAIDTHGDDHLLAGNVCDVAGSTVGTQGHCYYISYGSGTQIRYNVGAGAPGYGIHLFDQLRSSNDFRREIRNVLIEGNLLKNSTQRSGMIIAMSDEGRIGNVIDNVVVRGNTFTANSHLGLVIGGAVRNVSVAGNTFLQNGRQGIHVANEATVSGIAITGNTLTQSDNSNCRNDCAWYGLAHIETGAAAGVVIQGNYYLPAPPVIIGGSDSAPATQPPAPLVP